MLRRASRRVFRSRQCARGIPRSWRGADRLTTTESTARARRFRRRAGADVSVHVRSGCRRLWREGYRASTAWTAREWGSGDCSTPGRDALSGDGPGEEPQRVDLPAAGENLVVQVRAGRAAGRADVADDVTARDTLSRADVEPGQMSVASRQAELVREHDQISVLAGRRSGLDRAGSRRVDGIALVGGDVDALMIVRLAGERVGAAAERAGQPAV